MGIGGWRWTALVGWVAAVLLGAVGIASASAYPYTLTRVAGQRVALTGHGCGDTPQAILALPAGARGFHAFPNEPSDKSIHDAAGNVVADPVGATFVAGADPYYLFTFRTSEFVCAHPDLYPGAAWSSHAGIGAVYHLTRYSTSRNPLYCGDINYVYFWVRAYRVSCRTARRLADPRTQVLHFGPTDDLAHGLGFRCRVFEVSHHQVRVACRRGASLVLFYSYRFD